MNREQPCLENLNDQQRLAVSYGNGPILILAGAGSGKTRAITHRIAYLIENRVCEPWEILAVTFTNKAANEMKTRLEELLPGLRHYPLLCTFHSFGVRVLRQYARKLGYKDNFTICATDDQKKLLKKVYKDLDLDDELIPVEKCRAIISRARNHGWTPDTLPEHVFSRQADDISRAFRDYLRQLKASNCMDFDDLILLPVQLFNEFPKIRQIYNERYQYLLIDEYQDTNAPQYNLVWLLTRTHQNVCAVGDEDQSIYGFRGADISNILRFESDFPGAVTIKLEQNYRSTKMILKAATAVVSNNKDRKDKTMWTDGPEGSPVTVYAAYDAREEAETVAREIQQSLTAGESKIAVLYRTNFQSRQFEEALRRLDISYKLVGGVSFYHRKEIRDSLACLQFIRDPGNTISLARIINNPPRGIGRTTQDRVSEIAAKREISMWEAIRVGLEENLFSGRSARALSAFAEAVAKSCKHLELPLHIALERILKDLGYIQHLEQEKTDEAESRLLNINELINVARDYEKSENPMQDFLDHASLRSEADDIDDNARVTLMTLHNAKGLEFPVVFLVGCEEGLFPHSRSIEDNTLEEERRLCYVGMTRAQKKLIMTYCKLRRFYGNDPGKINLPSRFLSEIPPELTETISIDSYDRGYNPASSPVRIGAESLFKPKPRNPGAFKGKTFNTVESIKDALEKKTGAGPKFKSGDTVSHSKFGRGQVLMVERAGDDVKITVSFPGKGMKKLLQSYAKLEKS
ncbi:MAG: UvrD-helicase domain-containing protein [Acidobacteriota bacterium]